jgi:predicted RND superfamily exporter protein
LKRTLIRVQHAKQEAVPGGGGSVTERLAWTLHHSLTSITATSFTTAAAFAANMASSVTPIRLFGAFMVIIVLLNYLFVVTVLLAFLVIRERWEVA